MISIDGRPAHGTAATGDSSRTGARLRRLALFVVFGLCAVALAGAATGSVAGAEGGGVSASPPAADRALAATPPEPDDEDENCFPGDVDTERDEFVAHAGAPAIIELAVPEPDGDDVDCTGYVLVGGDKRSNRDTITNFFDVLYVSGDFSVNTRLMGTDISGVTNAGSVYSGINGQVVSFAQNPNHPRFEDLTLRYENGTEVTTVEDIQDIHDAIGVSPLDRPLRPARYRLVMGHNDTLVLRDDGIVYPARPVDRTNLRLTKPTIDPEPPTVHIAPKEEAGADGDNLRDEQEDDILSEWTRRSTVAKGDRLILGPFQTTGYRGTMEAISAADVDPLENAPDGASPQLIGRLNDIPEGVNIEVTETNPGPNEEPARLDFSAASNDEVYVVFDDRQTGSDNKTIRFEDGTRYYIVIDTTRSSAFTQPIRAGDRFEVRFEYNGVAGRRFAFDHDGTGFPAPFTAVTLSREPYDLYPYFTRDEETVAVTTTFTVTRPVIEFDHVTNDGKLIVSNETVATLPGSTTLAPGTNIDIQLIAKRPRPPREIRIKDIPIGPNGSFAPTTDISKLRLDSNASVEAEVYLREQLYKRLDVVVARDPANPVRFEFVDRTANVTVTRGRPLSALAVTVENTGVDVGTQYVTLRVGEQVLSNTSLSLAADERERIDFGTSLAKLPVGQYKYVVVTDDDQVTGTVVVQATPTPTPTPTTTATPPPTTAPPSTTAPTSAPTPSATTAPPATRSPTPPPNGTDTPTPKGGDGSDETGFLGQSFLGLGLVSARDALAGAVVVGGAYIAGYWR